MPDYTSDQRSGFDFTDISTVSKEEKKSVNKTNTSIRAGTGVSNMKETMKSPIRSRSPSPPQNKTVVYILMSEFSSHNESDIELARLIRRRVEEMLQIRLTDVAYYSKLGVGVVHVRDDQEKHRLIKIVGKIALDPSREKPMISFIETIELVSYIVVNVTNEKNNIILPTVDEIRHRWIELSRAKTLFQCEQLNIQFPNIYRIVSTSLDELVGAMSIKDFKIKQDQFAQVYFCADCSFLEDLPKSITEHQLREAIGNIIEQSNISSSSLCINLNKQAQNACILAAGSAQKWTTASFLVVDGKPISKKEDLPCRLLLRPVPQTFAVDTILKHNIFAGKATTYKHRGERLVLELSDKNVFDECIKLGALRIGDKSLFYMEINNALNNPEESEIDADTWYESDMLRYTKPDIMQFVADLDHNIFRFKWNSQIWLEQFNRTAPHNRGNDNNKNNANIQDRKGISGDVIRHQLRMTVMLNTIAIIRKKSYMIGDREIKLNVNKKLKTIVYNHRSKLERGGAMTIKNAPYDETKVKVINKDCLIVYEECVKEYKNPLLLNMASATSPGGGYRKGDGAQEENLFRRSDYFRSLDIGLDHIQEYSPERYRCSTTGEYDSTFDSNSMYPMDEYGAIYTSGLTVFRQPEDKGYPYMNEPLYGVSALAMAAYRGPKLDGKMLAPKYAVGMRKKIENTFAIAHHHKHDCLILSALGCGAFANPPDHVAQLFSSVIDQYAGFFKLILFAIVDDHNTGQQTNPDGNFLPFQRELDGKLVKAILPPNRPNTIFGPYRLLSNGSQVNDVGIFDMTPCNFGAKCTEMYDSKHATEFSHPPLCTQACLTGKCLQTKDIVHMSSFVHLHPCKHGAQCKAIDNEKHGREFEHPSYCPAGGRCYDTSDEHEKTYRHLPLCPHSKKCTDFRFHVEAHCNAFRHCTPRCIHGNYCVNFHDKKHISEYEHPFPIPCPFTPYHCSLHDELTHASDPRKASYRVQQHCLDFAHVCHLGRNCTDTNVLHLETSIHIPRFICKHDKQCTKIVQEDHLNSCAHSNIYDIRRLCKHADHCHDRRKPEHIAIFRHGITFGDSGVVRYYNLNRTTNFVQNQKENIARVNSYIQAEKWKSLPSAGIPREIIDWIRTVQPVHRCNPEIFESILLHGHVMSREYMEHLKKPKFVAHSVLQHSRIRRIDALKVKEYARRAIQYITALVAEEFSKNSFLNEHSGETTSSTESSSPDDSSPAFRSQTIRREEVFLSNIIHHKDMEAMHSKAIEIAQASIKLHSTPAGIGYPPDKALGTNKHVFSIIGPHLGFYYGDVVIVLKREILHHPDANYSIQAATSFASGKAYQWRPWLGSDSGSENERIKLYHKTKLHASVPGYEYATALELMAVTSHDSHHKTMDIDLQKILKRWCKVDSHQTIEGHLPQLIPLDYIDHIYMTQEIFDSLNENAHRAIKAVFGHRITLAQHKSKDEYNKFVVEELIKKFGQRDTHSLSRPIRGSVITIPSTDFGDHLIMPLTISQAFTQYRIENPKSSTNNTTYIYWQAMNGDMMLTLSNEQINPNEKQPKLRCLICYIAEKSRLSDMHYHENASYLNTGLPSQHYAFVNKGQYAAKSTAFYVGCNTDDFMTFCLELQRSTGTATLSHAGPNSIYNHETISCTFAKTEFDLTKLEFVYVSAGTRTVPIRNLIISFEKIADLHPTFDKDFKKGTSSTTAAAAAADAHPKQSHGDHHASSPKASDDKAEKSGGLLNQVKQIKNQVVDFIVGGDNSSEKKEEASKHDDDQPVSCKWGSQCRDIVDGQHRAKYSHPSTNEKEEDSKMPCKWGLKCHNHESDHVAKYSHPQDTHSKQQADDQILCKWGAQCYDQSGAHRTKYSHSTQNSSHQAPCKWGAQCHDQSSDHRAKFSHHSQSSGKKHQANHRPPCNWGAQCHDHSSDHRTKYSHN